MLQIVRGLLELVHDAEDEGVALRTACSWIRTHAGARAVAITSHASDRVVVEDGWRQALRGPSAAGSTAVATTIVSAPVCHGGSVIGHVVARGPGGELVELEEAVQALAALAGPALWRRLEPAAPADESAGLMPEIIGCSPVIGAVRRAVCQAARSTFPVLIEGESGTGKELVARALHRLSLRTHRRFTAVNCAALADDLVDAELFGFARGAFTGAVTARSGLFEEASGGSLFLDEISELSARAQAKVLRALQEREVRRVGENTTRPIDVRVIAATNQSLAGAVQADRFRGDLLFRLMVVRITLPPLRERLEDLPALASAFWRQAIREVRKDVRLTRGAMGALSEHRWPGNVRELQNVTAALAVWAPKRGYLDRRSVRQFLDAAGANREGGTSLEEARRRCEHRVVVTALARHGGRRTAAARELGLSRQGLSKAIRRLGLTPADDASGVA